MIVFRYQNNSKNKYFFILIFLKYHFIFDNNNLKKMKRKIVGYIGNSHNNH